jgi:hypothetical protein
MMFFRVFTDPVTPARINFSAINTNIPAASAPAIGNPTCATSVRKSMVRSFFLFISSYFIILVRKLYGTLLVNTYDKIVQRSEDERQYSIQNNPSYSVLACTYSSRVQRALQIPVSKPS